jgi:isochorismate synthase
MEDNLLQQKIEDHYADNLPFVVYCLPNSDTITGYFQKNNTAHIVDCFSEDGIIIAPFDCDRDTLCIPESESEVITATFTKMPLLQEDVLIFETEEDHLEHIGLVNKAKGIIKNKLASKIVVSRRKEMPLKNFELSTLFNRLFHLFPDTFRYLWFHPKTGLWGGASPELLLKTDGLSFTTMALAGTKKVNEKRPPDWTIKEIDEQKFVVDTITTVLQKVTSVVKLSKTITHITGSLAHLRTDITGILKNRKATTEIIAKKLHPTPAVCGTPGKIAKEFILANEGYDREFYTGYIGPVRQGGAESQIFVNLRCLKIVDSVANLYVGGGITAASNADEEWEETKNKLQTMLQVLRPFL